MMKRLIAIAFVGFATTGAMAFAVVPAFAKPAAVEILPAGGVDVRHVGEAPLPATAPATATAPAAAHL